MGYYPKTSEVFARDLIISLTMNEEDWATNLCGDIKGHGFHPVALQNKGVVVIASDEDTWIAKPATMLLPKSLGKEAHDLIVAIYSKSLSQKIKGE